MRDFKTGLVFALMLLGFALMALGAWTHISLFAAIGAGVAVIGGWFYFKGAGR